MGRLRGLRNITCKETSQDQECPWGSAHRYQQLKQKEGNTEPVNKLTTDKRAHRTTLQQCPLFAPC